MTGHEPRATSEAKEDGTEAIDRGRPDKEQPRHVNSFNCDVIGAQERQAVYIGRISGGHNKVFPFDSAILI
jgi:hypothetical protein